MPAEEVLKSEWVADGRIICFRFVSTGSEAAEKFYNDMVSIYSDWDINKPQLYLFDLRQSNNLMSAEMMRGLRSLGMKRPGSLRKTAVLIDSQQATKNIESILQYMPAELGGRKMFSDEQEAIDWLLEP